MTAPRTVEVTLPRLGETMEGAEVLAWLKGVGERVGRGEALFEVQTDKITVEVPALEAGMLTEILVPPGEAAEVGQVVARIEVDHVGEEAPPPHAETFHERPQETVSARDAGLQVAAKPPTSKVRASPSARRLARELGVDLAALTGTGPKGRVTSEDVRRAAQVKQAGTDVLETPRIFHPLTRTERASADATAKAFREIPHFYVRRTCDATRLAAWLEQESVTLTSALVCACARALMDHPRLNATLEEGGVRLHPHAHIGVITATPEGLVTSVVPEAETLSPFEVHARLKEVRARVRSGRALPGDTSGATFCVSNLGMFGVDEFSAIIPPKNVAILAVGALREEALVEGGALRFARTLALTVSADHRALDGVAVASFLGALCDRMQEPDSLFGSVT